MQKLATTIEDRCNVTVTIIAEEEANKLVSIYTWIS